MVEVQKEGRIGGAICPVKAPGRHLLNGLRDQMRFGASGNGASGSDAQRVVTPQCGTIVETRGD
jgi:hypothetical protein